MKLLQSWKESCAMLIPSPHNMFVPVAKKAESDIFLYNRVNLCLIISLIAIISLARLGIIDSPSAFSLIGLVTLLGQFFVVLEVRESNEYKDSTYFKKNIKSTAIMLIMAVLVFLVAAAIPLLIFQFATYAQGQESVTVAFLTTVIYIALAFVSGLVLLSINPFGIIFFLDKSDAQVSHNKIEMIMESIKEGFWFIIYNMPFLIVLGIISSIVNAIYMDQQNVLIAPTMDFLKGVGIIVLKFVWALVGMALQVAVYNYRNKHVIDRNSHYYARHSFEG